jgi:hypothetical protein
MSEEIRQKPGKLWSVFLITQETRSITVAFPPFIEIYFSGTEPLIFLRKVSPVLSTGMP